MEFDRWRVMIATSVAVYVATVALSLLALAMCREDEAAGIFALYLPGLFTSWLIALSTRFPVPLELVVAPVLFLISATVYACIVYALAGFVARLLRW